MLPSTKQQRHEMPTLVTLPLNQEPHKNITLILIRCMFGLTVKFGKITATHENYGDTMILGSSKV